MDAKHGAGKDGEKKQTSNNSGGQQPWWVEEDLLERQAREQSDRSFDQDIAGLQFDQQAIAADSRRLRQQQMAESGANPLDIDRIPQGINEGIGKGGNRQAQG